MVKLHLNKLYIKLNSFEKNVFLLELRIVTEVPYEKGDSNTQHHTIIPHLVDWLNRLYTINANRTI